MPDVITQIAALEAVLAYHRHQLTVWKEDAADKQEALSLCVRDPATKKLLLRKFGCSWEKIRDDTNRSIEWAMQRIEEETACVKACEAAIGVCRAAADVHNMLSTADGLTSRIRIDDDAFGWRLTVALRGLKTALHVEHQS